MLEPYIEQRDLDLVAAFLSDRGLVAERFTRAETQIGRTPDYRVRQNGNLVAYCEVKAPNDPWLDEQLKDAPAFTIVGGLRSDPVFNRLARLLIKADTQFAAVNPARGPFNILAYVNRDDASHFGDLDETLTGYFRADDGTKHPTMLNIAEGRIGDAKRRIDAFLWFEARTRHLAGAVINQADEERKLGVCALLGFDPDAIS
jgi:hypothetical protein